MTQDDDSIMDLSGDKTINSMNDRAAGVVMGTAGNSANLLGSTLGLSGTRQSNPYNRVTPGELPGIEHLADVLVPPESGRVSVSYIDYSVTKLEMGEVTDLAEFLAKPLPNWVTTRWLNVSHPHPYVINQFRHHFAFHTLTAEDVMHIPQRSR